MMNLSQFLQNWSMICVVVWLSGILMVNVHAEDFKISKTNENIPKKVLIVKQDAKIFRTAEGNQAEQAPFMQLYFLMSPEKNGRVPVSKSFSLEKTQPDGWLEQETFVEWNTVQMIDFIEPQQGRELAMIFDSFECSQRFGKGEPLEECQELGKEPKRHSANPKQYKLLIPVFQQNKGNYHAGFISVQEEDRIIKPVTTTVGYDLVLVVDSTLSMTKYFRPTMTVLQTFVKQVQESMKGSNRATPLYVGLLFYRDRDLKNKSCQVGYLTQWAQPLTEEVKKVTDALEHAESTDCNDLDDPEAVFDGLNRAIVDTEWHDTHFKSILLIGDAPPHPASYIEKNPFKFSVESISQSASESEKNIRFLTFKIEDKDSKEFKELALATEAGRRGQFRTIAKGDISQFEQDLQKALSDEWGMVVKAQDYSPLQRKELNITDYEYPIIRSNFHLPFIMGWVPQKIKGQLVIGEYVFMRKSDLRILVNNLDTISTRFADGEKEGGEMVVSTIRDALATQLKLNPSDIFQPGESLGELLRKAYALPFRSEILSFTPEQINTFKPPDFQKIKDTLSEKVKYLREFSDNPQNFHNFGEVSYLYVPRAFFP